MPVTMVRPCDQTVPGILAIRILLDIFVEKRTRDRSSTELCDYNSEQAWCCLYVEPAELSQVVDNREVYTLETKNKRYIMITTQQLKVQTWYWILVVQIQT